MFKPDTCSCREHRADSPATERVHRCSLSKLRCPTLSEIRSEDVKSAYPLDPSSKGDLEHRGAGSIGEHCEIAVGKGKERVNSYNHSRRNAVTLESIPTSRSILLRPKFPSVWRPIGPSGCHREISKLREFILFELNFDLGDCFAATA